MTVLQFLREYTQTGKTRQTGTKEGCAEGDCGACTVVIGELVNDNLQLRSVNACIQFLPTLDGKALFTVEDLHSLLPVPDGTLHQYNRRWSICMVHNAVLYTRFYHVVMVNV